MLDCSPMRIALALLLVPSLAIAEPHPQPLQPLPNDKLTALAPLLKGADLALIESTDKGHIKQLTTISLVAAPPETVREIVMHPEKYGDFVRNMVESSIKPGPNGTIDHQYKLSYKIYTVEGRHRYVALPPDGTGAAPVDMYDPDENGQRHYRWEFLPAGGGTVVVLYGFTIIPQDGFMKQYIDRAPTLELGLGLIPQMTLLLAVKQRAEAVSGHRSVGALAGTPSFGFLLQRGTVALFRSIRGQLAETTLLEDVNAPAEVVLKQLAQPGHWKEFVPTIETSYDVGQKDGYPAGEWTQSVPLLSWTSKWQLKLDKTSVDMFAYEGDLRQSRMRWDVQPLGANRSQLVLRTDEAFEDTSIVLRSLYKLEPLFQYGINVGLEMVVLKGIGLRAEQLAPQRASK